MFNSLITLLISTLVLILSFAVDSQEYQSKEGAEGTDNDIADCKEEVFTSKSVCSAHDKMLLTIIWLNIELVIYSNLIESFFQSWLAILWCYITPKFSEVRKTCSSHPNNKVFVLHVPPLLTCPIAWNVFKFVFDIRCPRDVFIIDWHSYSLTSN